MSGVASTPLSAVSGAVSITSIGSSVLSGGDGRRTLLVGVNGKPLKPSPPVGNATAVSAVPNDVSGVSETDGATCVTLIAALPIGFGAEARAGAGETAADSDGPGGIDGGVAPVGPVGPGVAPVGPVAPAGGADGPVGPGVGSGVGPLDPLDAVFAAAGFGVAAAFAGFAAGLGLGAVTVMVTVASSLSSMAPFCTLNENLSSPTKLASAWYCARPDVALIRTLP
ncbi:MAG: hypothetical protein PHS79_00535 [Patescibacteria group bacterium]|nr:hypothetical protein [Patescibacteria group bacterium]